MSTAEFNFEGVIISILCSENELMEEICKRFAIKAEKELNDLLQIFYNFPYISDNNLSKIFLIINFYLLNNLSFFINKFYLS